MPAGTTKLLKYGDDVVEGVVDGAKAVDNAIDGAKAADNASDAAKGGKEVKEGIYEFWETPTKKYVGQSGDVPKRLKEHVDAGRLDDVKKATTKEVKGGKTTREIAEHKRIQEITGGKAARKSDKVTNKKDPIGPKRKKLLEEGPPAP